MKIHSNNRGEKPFVGRNVVVIGGGNSGMDVATSALRTGCGKYFVCPCGVWHIEDNREEIRMCRLYDVG